MSNTPKKKPVKKAAAPAPVADTQGEITMDEARAALLLEDIAGAATHHARELVDTKIQYRIIIQERDEKIVALEKENAELRASLAGVADKVRKDQEPAA